MNPADFEVFLARIYVDPAARERFRLDPRGEAEKAGLSPQQCEALGRIDWTGLEMAARSFERKRNTLTSQKGTLAFPSRIRRAFAAVWSRLF